MKRSLGIQLAINVGNDCRRLYLSSFARHGILTVTFYYSVVLYIEGYYEITVLYTQYSKKTFGRSQVLLRHRCMHQKGLTVSMNRMGNQF